jgi:hypothetical protein
MSGLRTLFTQLNKPNIPNEYMQQVQTNIVAVLALLDSGLELRIPTAIKNNAKPFHVYNYPTGLWFCASNTDLLTYFAKIAGTVCQNYISNFDNVSKEALELWNTISTSHPKMTNTLLIKKISQFDAGFDSDFVKIIAADYPRYQLWMSEFCTYVQFDGAKLLITLD